MSKKFTPLLTLCLLLMVGLVHAQGRISVSGTVVDNAGEPLIGATVIEKGTQNAVLTDLDGKFSIKVASGETMLQIRFLGYRNLEVRADQIGTAKLVMENDALALDAAVVIGYGSVRKKDATGSVAVMKVDDINKGVTVTPSDLLKGKMAGVLVTSNSGAPGAGSQIRIRGGSSLKASNDPLIVIDGVPLDNSGIAGIGDPLSAINPNDIESMTVLKDASATAIYGSRASNGVIIVTTKKGSSGLTLTYSGNVQVNTVPKYNDVMNADEFRSFVKDNFGETSDAYRNLGSSVTDWQKEVLRTSVSTDHSISLSGAAKHMPYRVSVGYTDDNGIVKTSNFQRTSLSFGLRPSFLDDHLTLDVNAQGTYVSNRFADNGIVSSAAGFDPTRPVDLDINSSNPLYKYGNGYFMFLNPSTGLPIDVGPANPVDKLLSRNDESKVFRSIGSARLDYKIHGFEDLKLTVNAGYDAGKSDGNIYVPDNATMTWTELNNKNGNGITGKYHEAKVNTLLDAYINYNGDWQEQGMSKLDVMLGYSYQRNYKDGWNTETDNNQANPTTYRSTSFGTENVLVSFFGRLNYTLNEKYILTGTLRYDGSSRFSKDNRWGLFPSAAFAWRISGENFLKESQAVTDLKLRLGYGVTGQQDIVGNDYPYQARYTYSQPNAMYQFGSIWLNTLRPDGYDPNIKWEETTTWNIGLDFGFVQNRIWGSVDVYWRQTNDLINSVPVPAGTNLTNEIVTNIGNLDNRGVEISLNALPISTKDWEWEVNLNATWNQTRITKLRASDDPNYRGVEVGGIAGGTGNNVQVHSVGYSPYTFLLYEQVYDQSGRPMEGVYVDQNGDGIINDNDRVRKGSNQPKWYFGISTRLTYKDWDLGLNAHANVGNYVYNNRASNGEDISGSYISSGYYSNRQRSATYTNFNTPQYQSDYYLENASFFRLDNITLAYTFRNIAQTKLQARVSFTVQNVFVATQYTGLDPECFGIDNSAYPRPRTYMVGLNLKF